MEGGKEFKADNFRKADKFLGLHNFNHTNLLINSSKCNVYGQR